MSWKLDETVETSAGAVATGRLGSGPALVLAHGWPWSSFSWHRIIPELARRYRVHWYDMPGYGRSDKAAEKRTSLDVQGQVFAEILAHWELEQPMVVAHDFGGATTLRAHLLHGCDFERYVLMKAYIKGAIVNDIDPGDFEKLVEPWLSEEGRGSFYRQFAQADEKYTAEVEPMFGDIRCPVKIIWGEDDPWIPLERGKTLHALIPQAVFETLPGVGHLPQLEAPHLVLERLNVFLSPEGEA